MSNVSITWRLWRTLRNPPIDHPIVKRAAREIHLKSVFVGRWTKRFKPVFMVVIMFLAVMIFNSDLLLLATGALFAVIVYLALQIPLLGATMGGDCANLVSATIATDRESGLLELLSLTPSGVLGTYLLICCGCANQRKALYWFRRRILYLPLVVGTLAVPVNLLSWYWAGPLTYAVFVGNVLAVLVALHVHYLQSAMMGCLVGMLTPTLTAQPVYARMTSSGLFLALTILIYASGFYLFILIPKIVAGIELPRAVADMSITLLRLSFFVGLQEAINFALWQLLLHRLEIRESTSLL